MNLGEIFYVEILKKKQIKESKLKIMNKGKHIIKDRNGMNFTPARISLEYFS
jgi:hypothetical protein